MSRPLVLSVLVTAFCSLHAYGAAGDINCDNLDAVISKVSTDHDLSASKKDRIMGELQRADALCKEGKPEEADKVMEFVDDNWANRYLSDRMMESGH